MSEVFSNRMDSGISRSSVSARAARRSPRPLSDIQDTGKGHGAAAAGPGAGTVPPALGRAPRPGPDLARERHPAGHRVPRGKPPVAGTPRPAGSAMAGGWGGARAAAAGKAPGGSRPEPSDAP